MLAMDDDDDYFTPTTSSSRRLAMLFNPEDISSGGGGSSTGHHADLSTNFRFVAPKQPRPGRSNSSASPGAGQASKDGQELLLDMPLSLLPQGAEKTGMVKVAARCQVVGNAVKKSFTLVVVVQDKGELWRVVVDSNLLLEVVEPSTLRVTSQGKSLALFGEAQQIEDLVMQLAIYRAVTSSGPSQQDLCVGKGHMLGEGDVAKVHCSTHTITSTALKGELIENVKGVKVTVSPASEGGWESCLAGATVDSHRLIFLPKQKDGKWLLPTIFHNITVLKVRTKGSKDKPPPATGSAAPAAAPTVPDTTPATQQQQQQKTVTSQDAPPTASSQNFTGQNGETAEAQSQNAQNSEASRKAALVSRMAQLGTPLFPPMPGAKVPQPSEATVETQGASVEEVSVPGDTPPPSTHITDSSTSTTVSTHTATSSASSLPSSTSTSVSTTTIAAATTTAAAVPVPVPAVPPHYQTHSPALDSTLALSICQLGTSVARISDKVDLLLTKVDKVEAEGLRDSGSLSPSDPEALMALASGLVTHNEKLRGEVEALERKLSESQTSRASLLTMNAELLEEKRELLRREAEHRKEEEDKPKVAEDVKDKEEPVKEQEEKETQTEAEGHIEQEDKQELMPEQVRSLVKSTLSGLFRHLSDAFSEEEQHSRPQVLRTVKSGLQVAYSTFVDNLEEIMGVEETTAKEEEGSDKNENQHEEDEKKENREKHNVEVRNGESGQGQA